MNRRWELIIGAALMLAGTLPVAAQNEPGPYARIAILRPHDGHTVDFEAGYVRHLEWHRQNRDTWAWYGWSITYGERQRWFVYASFGHSAASLDNPVSPAEDERDNILNVAPHVEYAGNALFEYLPALSRGTGVPHPNARLELTTVDLIAGAEKSFEAALAASSAPQEDTLWYRMVAGGSAPRYVRLRPSRSIAAMIGSPQPLPDATRASIRNMTIEILTLRPIMSYGIDSK